MPPAPPARRLPRRRPDLVVRPLGDRGRFVVKDPKTGAYFQIGREEQFLLERLDGTLSAAAVHRAFEAEFGEALSDAELLEFLKLAESQRLLDVPPGDPGVRPEVAALLGLPPSEGPPARPARTAAPAAPATPVEAAVAPPLAPAAGGPEQSLLSWRKSLIDPDRLFGHMVPWLGWVWTRGFLAASLLVVAAAAAVLVAGWADLAAGFAGAVRWETAALVWVTLLAATTLHEFAHGLTLKRFGGEVRELGVLVLFGLPCLFCNVSDAWLLQQRWKRLLVTLAGGYCDLLLWAVAVFVWRLTPIEGLVNYLAFVALTVLGARVVFNFNPFLKLDGYYLLSDWLEVPNLLQRGQDRAKAHLRRLLWGAAAPPADPRGFALTAYGLASWGYGVAFLSAATYGLVRGMWAWVGPAGVAVGVGLAAVLVRGQLKGLAEDEVKAMALRRPVRAAAWLAALAALAGLGAVPVSDRAGGAFRVRPGGRSELRAPAAVVLREVFFDEGDDVPAGAVVLRLEVPDLTSRQLRKRAEVAEARARLDLLEAGPSPAAVAELTDRAGRSDRWHALGGADLVRAREVHTLDLARLDAQHTQAEAAVSHAEAGHERLLAARRSGAASADEYDGAVARRAAARGQLAQAAAERRSTQSRGTMAAETELARRAKELADARGELAVLKAGPRPEEVTAARAALARAGEEARYLDELAGRLTVRAARGGVLTTARPRERVGRLFQEGELIAEVEDASGLEVEVLLKEGQAARVGPGQEVTLLARAMPFGTLRGRVQGVAPAARRPGERPDAAAGPTPAAPPAADAEGQVAVYCVLEAGASGLRPGMTGHARIDRGDRPAAAVLSESLVRTLRIEFWR